jgi:D-alanine--poly(phosphoribitol) ligase subunit 2
MSASHILCDQIRNVLGNDLGLDIPSAETDLLEAGILDSMSFVELVLQLENKFGIRVNFEDVDFGDFRTVEKIADFVASRSRVK